MKMFLVITAVVVLLAALKTLQPRIRESNGLSGPVAAAAAAEPWIRLGRSMSLGVNDRVTEVILASPLTGELDVRCLRYEHSGYLQATLVCPGVTQDDMAGLVPADEP